MRIADHRVVDALPNYKEESMQKFTRRFVMGSAMALGLSAGAGSAVAEDDYKWPAYFSVITPIVGSANHSLAVAWSTEFTAQTGIRVAIKPAPNGYARPEWLNSGEGDIALMQASDYFDQMDAAEGFMTRRGGPSDTRVATMNLITPWGYIVRNDGKVKSFTDVNKDTAVAYTASSSFLAGGMEALLSYNGLTGDDANKVETSNYGANTAVVTEGRAEVAFTSPLSGTSYEAEATPGGVTWLELPKKEEDPEAYARYRKLAVGYVPAVTSSGTNSETRSSQMPSTSGGAAHSTVLGVSRLERENTVDNAFGTAPSPVSTTRASSAGRLGAERASSVTTAGSCDAGQTSRPTRPP